MTIAIGILCGVIGLFIGIFFMRFINSFIPRGVLYINTKDPSKDLYRLEVENLDDLEYFPLFIIRFYLRGSFNFIKISF